MAVKEPIQDQNALINALKLIGAASAALDTHKNVAFAGEKGRQKYKDTDFKDADSIMENAVEGTDIMENLGMSPGGAPAYIAGTAYDVFNPANILISAISKTGGLAGKLAKALSPTETLAEIGGKQVVKKALPKYVEQKVRSIKDLPLAPRIAEELIETGASKQLGNPKKALEILKGKTKTVQTGGSKALPILETVKEEGSLDKVGKQLEATVKKEAQSAKKINKADIYRKEKAKIQGKNAEGVEYKKNEAALDKVLIDALSPFETKTQRVIETPVPKMKSTRDLEIDEELSKIEEVANLKKRQRDDKYFTPADEPPSAPLQSPPPVPSEYDEMGLEDLLATISNKKGEKAKVMAENASADAYNKNIKPVAKDIQFEADVEAGLDELWAKKVALRKEFKESTLGKPMHEWTEKDKTLESVIREIDDEIVKRMSVPGQDAYAGLNQKYRAQKKGADIFEDQLQSNTAGGGRVARLAAEAGAGGAGNPASIGRATKEVVDAMTGPKRQVQLGNWLQNRKWQTPIHEGLSEATEIMTDPPYLKDAAARHEQSKVDHSAIPEEEGINPLVDYSAIPDEPTRDPQSVVEIPGAGDATDIMAPTEDEIDLSEVPEEGDRSPQGVVEIKGAGEATDIMKPQDPIDQKMEETLNPEAAKWDPYVNEEILNTPLPRNTERLLANPNALMAKMSQVAPNQVSVLKDMMANDPEGLKKAAPKIAMAFPTVFENDDYGMFDGKILDPMLQQKFLMDLADDEEMDSIQKANMDMKVRRGVSIHE